MKRKKILFFHFDLGNGGAERVLVNLANSLDPEKYDVEIRTIFDNGPNRQMINGNVKYTSVFHRKPFRGGSVLLQLLSPRLLHKLFIKGNYDAEIAFREGCPSRIISGAPDDVRKFSWIHTTLKTEAIAARGYRSLKEFRKCNNRFNKIATVSDSVGQWVKRWLPENENIATVYNVIDSDEIKRKADAPIDYELKNDGTGNLITVGRLTAVKGYDRLLHSLKNINERGVKNWHLYIIGIGELEQSLKDLSNEFGLGNHITFLGFQSNPHKFVSKMDLFVCSSLIEGYSTAVTEAIINHVPVLTTDCAGMREIFANSGAGQIVENSESGLEKGLQELLSNPGLLKKMKQAAERRARFFSKEDSIAQFEKFIFDE